MRKNLLATICFISAMFVLSNKSIAQHTLLEYWDFDSYTTVYTYSSSVVYPIGPVRADYCRFTPATAAIWFGTDPGTSSSWHSTVSTLMDPVATVLADYDTVNVLSPPGIAPGLSGAGSIGLRPRNPLDSAYLYFYIPTTGFNNIVVTWAAESSSTASGDGEEWFDYSKDSGLTWNNALLSEPYDSAWLVFKRISVNFTTDAGVNNNPKLVFRIHFINHANGTSGNNRFDNISVMGDSIINPVVIHYWDFNTYATTYTYSSSVVYPLGPIHADYSAINTATTGIWFGTEPGTSSSWHSTVSTLMDPVATVLADYDTVNVLSPPGVTPGVSGVGSIGIRPRNPLDSAYLYFYIPTTGYHNISLTWGAESSSTASGDGEEWFDYSKDSGLTWNNALLSEPYDSAWLVFKRISVNFTSDSGVNNNPKLVFRIHFIHNASLTSGNNRFDNISVNGVPYIASNSISTTAATFGPFCNTSADNISVAYTSAGTFTGTWSVLLSNSSGSFASGTTTIGMGTASPISATIPSGTPAGAYRVRVINSAPATNSSNDNGTNIIINAPPTAYNVTGSAAYCAGGTGVPVGLSGSQSSIRYYLYRGGSYVNDSLNGSGSALSFGNMITGGTYTAVAINTLTPTCTTNMTGSAVVTVNPVPTAIAGNNNICAGETEVLSDALTGGTWSSGFTAAATIDPTSGLLAALTPGLSVITYTLPTGCFITANAIINGPVPPIGGATNVCTGQTTPLSDGGSGTWSSSNTALATIDMYAGTVSGVAAGSPTISFITTLGCTVTYPFTVNQTPPAIGGPSNVCVGFQINLIEGITGGTWSSSDATAGIDPTLGTLTGMSSGSPTITYTLPGGCTAVTGIAVNAQPSAISGTPFVCAGSVTSLSEGGVPGSWSSSNRALATVDGLGNVSGVSAGSPAITFTLPTGCQTVTPVTVDPLPSAIIGTTTVCQTQTTSLNDFTSGGAWSSSNTAYAVIDPVAGTVTGVSAGTSSITYSLPTGCIATTSVLVNQLPGAIGGNTNACQGQVNVLSDIPYGGTWSANNTNVSIGVSSGYLSGVAPGTSVVTYTLPTGCAATTSVVVNPLSIISGITAICSGLSSTLSEATTGGTWSSSNTSVVTIDPLIGFFNAPAPGMTTITYTLPTGCATTSSISVALSPGSISGATSLCTHTTTTLVDPGGGEWTSSNTTVATVGITSGTVSGIAPGAATITYTLGTGCTGQKTLTINPAPAAVTGITAVCAAATTALFDGTPGGSWAISSRTGSATIDPAMGIVSGITPGDATVTYTTPLGCTATATVIVNQLPAGIRGIAHLCAAAVSSLGDSLGGGAWSSGNTALATVNAGTGLLSGVSAGLPVISYTLPTGCFATVVATIYPLPTVYTVTGGGSYCAGSGGLHIGLSSSATDVTYQLYYGISHVGGPVAGTGLPLDFGAQTLVEVYTISAIDGITGCADNMAGTAPVTENPLPAAYIVTGGGSFCSGGSGVHIGLDGSNSGVNYQLLNGGSIAIPPITGFSGPIDFGSITAAGRYTVLATNSATGCSNNMIDTAVVIVNPTLVPSVSLSAGPADILCSGRLVTITATPANGGATPYFSWTLNGVSVSVLGGSYSYLPSDGDHITATLTSSAACATPASVTSALTLSVLASGAPEIHVVASPGSTVCGNTMVNFTSTSSFGGSSPSLSWVVNGAIASFGSSYSYTPGNGDVIYSVLGSNYQCRTSDTGFSNHITMSVTPSTTPTILITGAPGFNVSYGVSDTLYATVTNAGSDPFYQWYVNGVRVPGAVYPTFISSNFLNLDSVRCEVTTSGVCSGITNSSFVTIHVTGESVQQIISMGSDIRLLPNPNNGTFTVKGALGTIGDEAVTLVVTDMLGQVIYSKQVKSTGGKIDEQIALADNLTNGMYLLNVRSASQSAVFHFVIARQ